jgi:hypothetical protein
MTRFGTLRGEREKTQRLALLYVSILQGDTGFPKARKEMYPRARLKEFSRAWVGC